ncbi:S-layer homology domain-containing protein [Oscillospiraceae bacterium 38-13]
MKKALLSLLALCCLTLPAQAAGFYDVPGDHWAAGIIQEAVESGAITGYGDGSFQPGRDVTAAQFCTMLSRTFLTEEFAAAGEGSYPAMDACLPVLKGTSVEETYISLGKRWDRYVNQPLSRYDMAQILYNLVSQKDTVSDESSAAVPEIGDWEDIPQGCRSAVSACWSMGLLQGRSDGRFAGEDHLNRAQAAAVWSRLNTLFNGPREVPADPDAGVEANEMPAFGLQGEETVQEMMNRVNRETPRCEEGRLPNGKSRTAENIQELLELVKQGCPDGTVWSGTERYDYKSLKYSPARGCMAFGMAVSDFVFGEEAPLLSIQLFRRLEVGDVVSITGAGVERVLILTEVDYDEDLYTACELELNGKVKWSQWGPISGLIDKMGVTMVIRRWQ